MTGRPQLTVGHIADSIDYGHTAAATFQAVGPKFLRITDIQNGRVNWDEVPFCQCSPAEERSALLQPGDIVFARTGATTGKSFLIREAPERAIFASYLIRVRPGPEVYPPYLAHFFQSSSYWRQIFKSTTGTAQTGVNATSLRRLKVPLPPVPQQKHIAAILDTLDALRAKRRESIALLNTLVQSIFVDMFGDPETNTKNIAIARLDEICLRITDGTHQPPRWSSSGVPFLFVRDIVSGEINFDTEKFISLETQAELTRRCPIEPGDVLYSTVGSYGVPALVKGDRKFAFQRHIAHLKPDREIVEPEFVWAMLATTPIKRQADSFARGVAQKTINLGDLRKFKVFRPSLDLQREFVRRVTATSKLRATISDSSQDLETLFSSLQNSLFKGDV